MAIVILCTFAVHTYFTTLGSVETFFVNPFNLLSEFCNGSVPIVITLCMSYYLSNFNSQHVTEKEKMDQESIMTAFLVYYLYHNGINNNHLLSQYVWLWLIVALVCVYAFFPIPEKFKKNIPLISGVVSVALILVLLYSIIQTWATYSVLFYTTMLSVFIIKFMNMFKHPLQYYHYYYDIRNRYVSTGLTIGVLVSTVSMLCMLWHSTFFHIQVGMWFSSLCVICLCGYIVGYRRFKKVS